MSEPIRVALVMDHPAQQFTRGFQLLSAEPDINLQVYYWSVAASFLDPGFGRPVSWDVDLLGGYTWAAPAPAASVPLRLRWIVRRLRGARPEVVICYGWGTRIARASIAYCLMTRTRLLLYGDSTWQHSNRGQRRIARSVAVRILTQASTGAISTGTFNREFYIRQGMDPRRIWSGVCPADTELFGRDCVDNQGATYVESSSLHIGFAGKLIPRKGVDELLIASSMLPRMANWSVTVVGDGPLMAELQELASQLGLDDRVTFRGFVNTAEMPQILTSFDVLVVPSRKDMRVLVTIEAMAVGAAVVVSDATAVWGPGDLIEDGVTGLVYPSGDPAALAAQLRRLLDDRSMLATIRSNGLARTERFGPASFARTTASAIRECLHSSTKG